MRFAILTLIPFLSFFAFAAPDLDEIDQRIVDAVRDKPGFDIEIDQPTCDKLFPYHMEIPRPLNVGDVHSTFRFFAFTAKPFVSGRPTFLASFGGPGYIANPASLQELAKQFENFNVVFFHPRGGGCSSLHHSGQEFDSVIRSTDVVEDLEALRKAYGLTQWQGYIAYSYDTLIARLYAHQHPESLKSLILDGLAEVKLAKPSEDKLRRKFIRTLRHRFRDSEYIRKYIREGTYDSFVTLINEWLKTESIQKQFSMVAGWDVLFQKEFDAHYANQPYPTHLHLTTFLSIMQIVYRGEDEQSDHYILMLMKNFSMIELAPDYEDSIRQRLTALDHAFFPFRFSDFMTTFQQEGVLSSRVHMAIEKNDKLLDAEFFCENVPTLVINGTQDLSTPVESVEKFLGNKRCAAGANASLLMKGAGHWNWQSCLTDAVASFSAGHLSSSGLDKCSFPVEVKNY